MSKRINVDIVGQGIRELAENLKDEKYKSNLEADETLSNEICDAITKHKNDLNKYQAESAVVQALFDSKMLNFGMNCFSTSLLIKKIYGVKLSQYIPMIEEAHAKLIELGYNDHVGKVVPADVYKIGYEVECVICDKTLNENAKGCDECTTNENTRTYNTSGDNYFSAYTFNDKRDTVIDTEIDNLMESLLSEKTKKKKKEKNIYNTRVIICENQSPTHAFILKPNTYSQETNEVYVVKIKENYNSKCRLVEFLSKVEDGTIYNDHNWSQHSGNSEFGIVAKLKVKEMELVSIGQPELLEYACFSIENIHCCIMEENDCLI